MPKRKHSSEEIKTEEKKPIIEEIHDLTYPTQNITWPKEDLLKLLSNIQDQMPIDEQIGFKIRLQRIDWTCVAFDKYNWKECREICHILLKKARKFRFLSEILGDLKHWISYSNSNINAFSDLTRDRCNRFWFYYNENRETIFEKNPKITEEELEFKLLRQFHSLLAKEKLKYGGLLPAKTEKNNSLFQSQGAENNVVDLQSPPKKPRTPYAIFRETERVNFPKRHNMTNEWKKLEDIQKCFYIKWSDEETEIYNEKLKQYIKTHPGYKAPRLLRQILTEKRIKDNAFPKPEVPPTGAYYLFKQIYFEIVPPDENAAFSPNEIWKTYSAEEKESFRAACQILWDEYERKFDEYLLNFPPEDRISIKVREGKCEKRPVVSKRAVSRSSVNRKTKKLKTLKVVAKPAAPPESVYKYFVKFYSGSGEASDVWSEMAEIDKQEYQSRFEEAQFKYAADLAKYLENLPAEEVLRIKPSCKLDNDSDISASEDEC